MTKVYPLPLNKEQVDKLLEEAMKENEFDYILFLTLATTGRRIGELFGVQEKVKIGEKKIGVIPYYDEHGRPRERARIRQIYKKTKKWRFGVKVSDIDFENGVMKIWTLKKRKFTDKDQIPIADRTRRELKQYINKNKLTSDDYVFRKKNRSLARIQQIIKYYAKKSGIPTRLKQEDIKYSLSLHSFRHYFVTEMQKKGVPNDKIIKLTGHKNISTLSNYSHTLGTDFKKDLMPVLNEL